MTPHVTELVAPFMARYLVRDKIAEILKVELEEQARIAQATDGVSANDYRVKVYLERSNPISEFREAPNLDCDPPPRLVHVWFDNGTFPKSMGNVVKRQQGSFTYNVDCYAGAPSSGSAEGHDPGDRRAVLEAQRVESLAAQILMAAHYTYLDMRGVVGQRWISNVTSFQPEFDGKPVVHVAAVRLAVEVSVVEVEPQVVAELLELIHTTVKRSSTGEVLLTAQFDTTP